MTVSPTSAFSCCIQYNDGTTRPFRGIQLRCIEEGRWVIYVRFVREIKCPFQSFLKKTKKQSVLTATRQEEGN